MLIGYFDRPLVLVSVLVAILASFTALSMAGRVASNTGASERSWIAGGAFAMSIGIWSMHFIGMLAFRLPIPVGYDPWITTMSWLLAFGASWLALWQISQPNMAFRSLVSAAVLMGIGINAMHYTGMAAMRMQPGIEYDVTLFILSVAIAILASGAALWIAFRLRDGGPHVWIARGIGAVVMGIAIAGMHYTGMAAAAFPENSICMAASNGFGTDGLAISTIIATVSVLVVALLTSIYDSKLTARTQTLVLSQAISEERHVLLAREREARAEAEKVSAMKDEFLATLSHELRTPLNSILGWTQLLRLKTHDAATIEKGLETIERNARAQAQLIADLLDMSRIISGKVRMEMRPITLQTVVDSAVATIMPTAQAKNIVLESHSDPEAGVIAGDADRLQQVMWNLLSNAVKFSGAGGKVQVISRKVDDHVVVTVTDSGIGISPEFLPFVFDRFRQADSSTTRRYGGLGLGLAIVRQLVELHGGTIRAESGGEGKGASFIMRLPVAQPGRSTTVKPGEHRDADVLHMEAVQPFDLSGITALVVDDDLDALGLVDSLLSECGAEVIRAASAEEALRHLGRHRPDVIISDIGMPGEDGFGFMRKVRAFERGTGNRVPAIALSAFTRLADREQALAAGFDLYISKPFEPAELAGSIRSIVEKAPGSRVQV
ncbi:MAG TPA: MHYT domain-containing protein [Noviherbaspirillum sp.]|jgi:signal transduction histidine kinase/ActR/RegA family two-component response regulator|uniref:MHYT domain-containing protein n=1 Tax=Noviherbaspirillum sp. TaxID=1926288 RepID=UPI002DDCC2F5|nr:MHYT domain-containing protein [Noviherbaspirillum sp.]HEV2612614.1 MHYT domain-containing protein [Noviherbaspirillum sp.]